MYNPYTLLGKNILITGASSGIGKCTAIECSKMGANVIITGRNKERLDEVYNKLEGEGHSIVSLDLSTEDAIRELVEMAPQLDGIFFCAGVTDTTLTKFIEKEKIDRVFEINLISPMLLTKWLIKRKKINKYASLVYMSSMGTEVVTSGLGIYAASKSGLNSFMRSVANELASRKIRANSIMASMIKSELITTLTSLSAEDLAKDESRYPLGYGNPIDVALAAVFLLSDASKWITGSSLKMDGGSTLG